MMNGNAISTTNHSHQNNNNNAVFSGNSDTLALLKRVENLRKWQEEEQQKLLKAHEMQLNQFKIEQERIAKLVFQNQTNTSALTKQNNVVNYENGLNHDDDDEDDDEYNDDYDKQKKNYLLNTFNSKNMNVLLFNGHTNGNNGVKMNGYMNGFHHDENDEEQEDNEDEENFDNEEFLLEEINRHLDSNGANVNDRLSTILEVSCDEENTPLKQPQRNLLKHVASKVINNGDNEYDNAKKKLLFNDMNNNNKTNDNNKNNDDELDGDEENKIVNANENDHTIENNDDDDNNEQNYPNYNNNQVKSTFDEIPVSGNGKTFDELLEEKLKEDRLKVNNKVNNVNIKKKPQQPQQQQQVIVNDTNSHLNGYNSDNSSNLNTTAVRTKKFLKRGEGLSRFRPRSKSSDEQTSQKKEENLKSNSNNNNSNTNKLTNSTRSRPVSATATTTTNKTSLKTNEIKTTIKSKSETQQKQSLNNNNNNNKNANNKQTVNTSKVIKTKIETKVQLPQSTTTTTINNHNGDHHHHHHHHHDDNEDDELKEFEALEQYADEHPSFRSTASFVETLLNDNKKHNGAAINNDLLKSKAKGAAINNHKLIDLIEELNENENNNNYEYEKNILNNNNYINDIENLEHTLVEDDDDDDDDDDYVSIGKKDFIMEKIEIEEKTKQIMLNNSNNNNKIMQRKVKRINYDYVASSDDDDKNQHQNITNGNHHHHHINNNLNGDAEFDAKFALSSIRKRLGSMDFVQSSQESVQEMMKLQRQQSNTKQYNSDTYTSTSHYEIKVDDERSNEVEENDDDYEEEEEDENEKNNVKTNHNNTTKFDFDDNNTWLDTSQKKVDKLKSSQSMNMISSNTNTNDVSTTSTAPVSQLMAKLFPTLKPPSNVVAPSMVQTQQQVLNAKLKQIESNDSTMGSLLKEKLSQLENEIEKFRVNNAEIKKLKEKHDNDLKQLEKSIVEFEKQKIDEIKKFKDYKEEEIKKLKQEKKLFEQFQKSIKDNPDRRERDEIERLKKQINELNDELKLKETRWTANNKRLKDRIEQLEKEKDELKQEVVTLEKQRLENLLNQNKTVKQQPPPQQPQQQQQQQVILNGKDTVTSVKQQQQQQQQQMFKVGSQSSLPLYEALFVDGGLESTRSNNNVGKVISPNSTNNAILSPKLGISGQPSPQMVASINGLPNSNNVLPAHTLTRSISEKSISTFSSNSTSSANKLMNGNGNHIVKYTPSMSNTPSPTITTAAPTAITASQLHHNQRIMSPLATATTTTTTAAVTNALSPTTQSIPQTQLPQMSAYTLTNGNGHHYHHNNFANIYLNGGVAASTATLPLVNGTTNSAKTVKFKIDQVDNEHNHLQQQQQQHQQQQQQQHPVTYITTLIHKKQLKLKEMRKCEDGRVERALEDGTIMTEFANGTVKEVSPDKRHTYVNFYNGDRKEMNLDAGTETYFYAQTNVTQVTYTTSGLQIFTFPNGQIEKHYVNKTKEITFPDKTIKFIYPDGTEESRLTNGTVIKVEKNGDKIIEYPNKQREIHTKEFKKREYPDGSIKTVFSNGISETRYANGRVRVKDEFGNIISDKKS